MTTETIRKADDAAAVTADDYRALFDAIDEGACMFDRLPLREDGRRDYRYVAMNKAMQAMFGIADLTGQTIRDNFPDEIEDWYDDYDRVLETGIPMRFERGSEPQGMVLEMFVTRISSSPPRLLAVMQDVTARRRAEERLRASEERTRALVNASSDVVYVMSGDWEEMRHLRGRGFLTDTEGPKVQWLDEYIFEEDQPMIRAAIQDAISHRGVFELEHRVKRADGSEGWTASRAVPVLDRNGGITEWFGMATDITERVASGEQQKLLTGELGHRLKNVLALVQSVAHQTFRKAENLQQAATAFQARLASLGNATDILTATSWSSATLESVIRAGLTSVSDFEDRIAISGPAIGLLPQAALSMTLTIHELATNAVKHGSLSADGGGVLIEWHLNDFEGRPGLVLTWREVAGPRVKATDSRGFGSRMIERLLASQLHGKSRWTFPETGVEFVLEAPFGAEVGLP